MLEIEKRLASISFEQSGPVNDADIQRYQSELNLQFGPDYKQFISRYGCIVIGPKELYGICGNNASVPSAIHATISARRDPQFPHYLLVIAEDGSGRKFCIDSNDEVFECYMNSCRKLGQSFEDFVVGWLFPSS